MTEFVQIKLYTKGGYILLHENVYLNFFNVTREWVDSSMKEK